MGHKTSAFTLVEMLVVVTIVAMLIAMLLPALQKARYAARLTVCLLNARQHGIAAITAASDDSGKFPKHYDSSPERYRTGGVSDSLWARLNAGGYMPLDGKITICPIIADGWAADRRDEKRYRVPGPEGAASNHGGWASNQPTIITAYCWTANYVPSVYGVSRNGVVTYLNNEPPWPERASTARPGAVLVMHRINDGGSPGFNVHDLGHQGRGLAVNSVLPVRGEMPLIFFDQSGLIRPADQVEKRAYISGVGMGYVYY